MKEEKEIKNNDVKEKKVNIIVPDTVDINEDTLESLQKEKCKKCEINEEILEEYLKNDEFEEMFEESK